MTFQFFTKTGDLYDWNRYFTLFVEIWSKTNCAELTEAVPCDRNVARKSSFFGNMYFVEDIFSGILEMGRVK